MLYVKFKIHDVLKLEDFKILYNHMVSTRQPDFEFEDEELPEFDWDTMNDVQMQEAFDMMLDAGDKNIQELKRYDKFIPDYANQFIEGFIASDAELAGAYGYNNLISSII